MKQSIQWLMAGFVMCATIGIGQETESRFFRIRADASIQITGISDGVMMWEQPVGMDVTVEVSEHLSEPEGWRRYTAVPGEGTQGSIRVFDRNTPQGMVLIPGGMNEGDDPDFEAYSLAVESFYMDRYPVTKALWDEVYNWATDWDRGAEMYSFDNEGSGKAPDHPVQTVNWYDVVKWCNARSEMEGRTPVYTLDGSVYRGGPLGGHEVDVDLNANGYRLPTLVEHKYASRGGLVGKRFPWGDTITHDQANYWSSDFYDYDISPTREYHPDHSDGPWPYTSPVGSFDANGYGLYDIAGNVWEWCWDLLDSTRSLRGGGWFYNAQGMRCGHVYWNIPGYAQEYYGFRTVMTPEL